MPPRPDDLCPRPERLPPQPTEPHAAPIYPASVYRCADPQQAFDLLTGAESGYVYRRDGHPNADLLAEKCRKLHDAERAVVVSSGMAALAAALLAQLSTGDHLVVSNRLYGRSLTLLGSEAARLGVTSTLVDTNDLQATTAAFTPATRMVVVETISNPLLRVSDIPALAELAHRQRALLLVDNSFASPAVCRPLAWGADLVLESLTKIMNGHSDVLLGMLAGPATLWERIPLVLSAWGMTASPFECWLAARGLGTLPLRAERAGSNALAAAEILASRRQVRQVHYPGLAEHPDHLLAQHLFGDRFGSVVTFDLAGGLGAAETFISAAKEIAFCPSLGEISTTLSHPASTSHRGLSAQEQEELGISGGTIRLSLGTESPEFVRQALAQGLDAVD